MTDIRCKAMWAQNSRETLRMQLLAREQNASVSASERYTVDDHEERDIHIYYNFVGYIEA